jgi:hypothetical protein
MTHKTSSYRSLTQNIILSGLFTDQRQSQRHGSSTVVHVYINDRPKIEMPTTCLRAGDLFTERSACSRTAAFLKTMNGIVGADRDQRFSNTRFLTDDVDVATSVQSRHAV